MRKITKRSAAIVAASVIAVGGGAAAWATITGWSITGTGTATGKAAEVLPMSAMVSVSDKLFPGYSGTVATKVSNPNEFPVKLGTTPVQPTNVVVSGLSEDANADCKSAIDGATDLLTASYPASAPTVVKKAKDQGIAANFSIGNLPQKCAGAQFTLTYTFSGTSTVS